MNMREKLCEWHPIQARNFCDADVLYKYRYVASSVVMIDTAITKFTKFSHM